MTVCQANAAVLPRLKDNGSQVTFALSGRAVVSAGPNREQAKTHIIAGGFDTPTVTLEVKTPRGESLTALYAIAHITSGNPPSPALPSFIARSRNWSSLSFGCGSGRKGGLKSMARSRRRSVSPRHSHVVKASGSEPYANRSRGGTMKRCLRCRCPPLLDSVTRRRSTPTRMAAPHARIRESGRSSRLPRTSS